jgi:probable F420-dependent oxidoreductase
MGPMKVRFAVAPGGQPGGTDIEAFAAGVENTGFDGIWLSDVPLSPILDPLVGLAFAAGQTKRLRLGANVVPLGRNPFLLAKALAQLDQVSEGRLLLSFVPGIDQPGERQALAVAGADRGAVLEEVLALVRSWWAGEEVTHHSATWSFTALPSAALPVQQPLEVWLGGRGPKALDRIGRVADGWLGAQVTPEEADAARRRINEAAANAGRQVDPEHFGLSIAYAREAHDLTLLSRARAQRTDLRPDELVPVGPDALRSMIKGYVDAGLSKFVLRPLGPVGSWDEQLAWLADAVLDLQTS